MATDARGNLLMLGQAVTLHADVAAKNGLLTGVIEHLIPSGSAIPRGGGARLGTVTVHCGPTARPAALEYCRAAHHPTDGSPVPALNPVSVDVAIVRLDAAGEAALVAWAAGRPVHPDHALDDSCGQLGAPVGARTCTCPVRAWLRADLVNP